MRQPIGIGLRTQSYHVTSTTINNNSMQSENYISRLVRRLYILNVVYPSACRSMPQYVASNGLTPFSRQS